MNSETCKVCGNSEGNRTFVAKEMMFGLRDEFEYLECSACGCLQIKEIPENLLRYYPEDYYSYSPSAENASGRGLAGTIKRAAKNMLVDHYLRGGKILRGMMDQAYTTAFPWLKQGLVNSRSRILDVGCGSGALLLVMHDYGFRNLTGVDPFINADIHYPNGITIHKKQLSELTEKYDLVMMHHAFEHMDEPAAVLRKIHALLNPGGMVLIRIPIADSLAWKKYGVDWVQLDAPRHFFLHTNKSIDILSKQTGFELADVMYDSWELQFYGSEKYRKGIPLVDERESIPQDVMAQYRAEAAKLNESRQGDSACFYLKKR